MSKPKLPKVIYLGASDFEVRHMPNLDLLGETQSDDAIIYIRNKQGAAIKRDTLLHEVLHAIFFLSGLFKTVDMAKEEEEKIVVTITPWILAALRDNPALVDYLLAGVK